MRLYLRNKILNAPFFIMGILNVTDDSFYDGGKYGSVKKAVAAAEKMIKDGANIIDVGGESTRPGAKPVSLKTEMKRVLPVVEALCSKNIAVSVDSYKSELARKALALGAQMINDISGFEFDKNMARVAADFNAAVCISHIKGTPRSMQKNPVYKDVLKEVTLFLKRKINYALKEGVRKNKIMVDPGIGFGKKLKHNLILIKNIKKYFKKYPVVTGVSNKTFIGEILNEKVAKKRIYGTIGAVAASLRYGSSVLRVHNVKECADALKVYNAIREVNV